MQLTCWLRDAPRTRACPTGIDVPRFIARIAGGDLTGSARYERTIAGVYDNTAVVIDAGGEMDRRVIEEVRNTWQFFRDRRPETYEEMVRI